MTAIDELPGRACSIAAALSVVGDRWSLLAVREVSFGNHRFNYILEGTAAPRDRLTARLKAMEAAQQLEPRQYQDAPPRFDYHLTPAGKDLLPVLRELMAWGDRWVVDEPSVTLMHHDHPLDARTVCGTCGEPVRSGTVVHRHNDRVAAGN